MTQYRTTTDENGDFSLDLPALEKGTYTMKAIFEGDSDAYGSEITKTLIIQGRAYAISIEANNEIIQSGDTTTLTLSFEDEDGDPVIEPGQTIKLYQEYVVSDIILTSDKDILSYADNDVATLTAKVKTSSGGIPVGVDVVFKKDGVLLDTVQTNTQGIATYSYASTGAGDITFSAECDLVSETYSLYDCIFYDGATQQPPENTWILNKFTPTYDTNGTTLTSTEFATCFANKKDTSTTVFDWTSPVAIEFYINNVTSTNADIQIYDNTNNCTRSFNILGITGNNQVKILVESDKIRYFVDGVEKTPQQWNVSVGTFRVGLRGTGTITFKEFMIYPI